MDDIVKDFLTESNENLDRLDQELVKLEDDPCDAEILTSIFRTIHTIKGSCGFLGFARLEKLTHAGENLLSPLRDGILILNSEITSALLAMVDAIRQMLAAIQVSGQDGEQDYETLIERLRRLQHEPSGEPSPPAAAEVIQPAAVPLPVEESKAASDGPSADRPAEPEAGPPAVPNSQSAEAATIRVGIHLLDQLMNLVGELVLARNQLLQFSSSSPDASFQALSQRMNLITSSLQAEVMLTRMQPIGNLWNRFPRTVRDLALQADKQVRIEMDGKETELDRTILEAIRDPLTHLVRNAVDHGIEAADKRKQAGKNPVGRLGLRAFHANGEVNIEISDDGAGLNLERIREKAVQRGLVTAAQASQMPAREVINLIFLPGFSTAEKISNVSGRGVGLDVVKTNVGKIGGAVEVQSAAGTGTTIRIKIPLTLAIMPALMVTCSGERFAIPQVNLVELVSIGNGTGKNIEMVHHAPVYRLRGRLLPVLYLNHELGLAGHPQNEAPADGAPTNLVVLQADGREFVLVVDEITDTLEIVVKPLSGKLKGIGVYSGATIMGDGGVALILDIRGLAERAHLLADAHDRACIANDIAQTARQSSAKPQLLLVAQCRNQGRVAIPLSQVERLEEFPRSAIEFAGAQQVIQYRGQVMPLLHLSRLLRAATEEEIEAESFPVVVYTEAGRSVGLVVDRVVDIVDESLVLDNVNSRIGVLGACSIQQKVTELIDVASLVREVGPAFLEARASG